VIGVSVDHEGVHAVLSDLTGAVAARHRTVLDRDRPVASLRGAIDALYAQLDAPLLCIGVGVPGEVDAAAGIVRHAASLGWSDIAVGSPLEARYDVPVYVGHGTELCAMAQYAYGTGRSPSPLRLVTLQVGTGLELGVTLDGGSVHYGGDLGSLRTRLPGVADPVSMAELLDVLPDMGDEAGDGSHETDYLRWRYRASRGDAKALARLDELADRLAPVVAWTVALLRPDQLTLAGPIVDLGEDFLQDVSSRAATWLPGGQLDAVQMTLAYAERLGPLGAVALAVQKELSIV
jgi:glucokinase